MQANNSVHTPWVIQGTYAYMQPDSGAMCHTLTTGRHVELHTRDCVLLWPLAVLLASGCAWALVHDSGVSS